MQTILVTGHTGFIGSYLIDRLSEKYSVVGLSQNRLENTSITQIEKQIQEVTIDDIPDDVSCVIHLAALTDVVYCEENPSFCFKINFNGTQNILDIVRKKQLKMIFLSTSHIFGPPEKLPIAENHPKNPTSIYSASKLSGEILCESYAKTYDLDISIIRFFSIYGPNSPSHLVTSKIISQLLSKDIVELGNVTTKRDFLYIDDAISSIIFVLEHLSKFQSYNVGSGNSTSIQTIFNKLQKISTKNTRLLSNSTTKRKNDVEEIFADISSIRNLGWQPQISLDEGLALTYNWFNQNLR